MKSPLMPIVGALLLTLPLHGQQPAHWVTTFTSYQPLERTPPRVLPAGAQPGPGRPGQIFNTRGFHDQTARMIVRTSIGGSKARIRLFNSFGGGFVNIGAAHIALRDKDSAIVPGSDTVLTFTGKPDCRLGPGVVLVSDPVDFAVPKDGDVAISLYFPGDTGPAVAHNGLHTSYISKQGDATGQSSIPEPTSTGAYYWLEGLDVLAPPATAAVVALGDSITESFRSTPDTNRNWPAILATRLQANKATVNVAVANMGIGGNRLLHDGTGASALARFDRDVLSQPGVKWVIVLEGINDIGHANTPGEEATAEALIAADKQIIERAHEAGIKAIGGTLPSYEGANYFRPDGEATRVALNNWIRTSGAFDAVVDFEKATQDPANPTKLKPEYDSGDHLHLSDAGYKAMGDAINLSIFTSKKN